MRDYGEDIFKGAADYYVKYRTSYPRQLFNDIARYYDLDGSGRLLDLGCGSGELAIPLSKYFENVLAIDPDDEMLKQGIAKAQKSNIANINWQKGSSKDLSGVNGKFNLIAMGQSFHWMDQEAVLAQLEAILAPGGGIMVVGTVPVAQNSKAAQKDQIIKNLLQKYLGLGRRAGNKLYESPPKNFHELFTSSKFGAYKERHYLVKSSRNIDQIVGNLYSMSWALRSHFENQIYDFERELRSQLNDYLGDGLVVDKTQFVAYFLRRK